MSTDMICEQHPDQDWPHDDCAGPGCPRSAAVPLLVAKCKLLDDELVRYAHAVGEERRIVGELRMALSAEKAEVVRVKELMGKVARADHGHRMVQWDRLFRSERTIEEFKLNLAIIIDLHPAIWDLLECGDPDCARAAAALGLKHP